MRNGTTRRAQPGPGTDTAEVTVGRRLREYRLEKGMIAADVASAAGISPSMLSQVERGTTSPSLKVLHALAAALDVTAAQLLEDHRTSDIPAPAAGRLQVVRHAERKVLRRATGPEYQLLSPDLTGDIEFLWVELAPGMGSAADASHEGEEQLVVLSGEVTLTLSGSDTVLQAGDAARYDSIVPHRTTNHGTVKAVFVSAATPPSF
jgi:transcriptional regulator with XRE-family HTH domain